LIFQNNILKKNQINKMTSANRFSSLFNVPSKVPLVNDHVKSTYADAFPSLTEAKESSDVKYNEVKYDDNTPNECTKTKFILGPRSYEDERREKYQAYEQESAMKRSEAYGILADKEKLGASLLKTRMCHSVDKNEVCVHGDKCRFAHTLDELIIPPCLFKENCRFVRERNGKLFNTGEKVCNHKHPQESTECFMYRVGLNRYKSSHPVIQDTNQSSSTPANVEVQTPPTPTPANVQVQTPPTPTPANVQVQAPPTPSTSKVDIKNETRVVQPLSKTTTEQLLIIRVPKELASRALEIALNSGKTHIQVELTD
jgi:hypothetical protein